MVEAVEDVTIVGADSPVEALVVSQEEVDSLEVEVVLEVAELLVDGKVIYES